MSESGVECKPRAKDGLGIGYGSKWHLLRFLAYHRNELNRAVKQVRNCDAVKWLDFPFDSKKTYLDAEWKGVDFLPSDSSAKADWVSFWPQSGNVPNWDAIGQVSIAGESDWLLVEAKAHLAEIKSNCGAQEHGGLGQIRDVFRKTKSSMGIADEHDWLQPYYQYANRLTVQQYLQQKGVKTRLLFLYFVGDQRTDANCPATPAEWKDALSTMNTHLGLAGKNKEQIGIHEIFLDVSKGALI